MRTNTLLILCMAVLAGCGSMKGERTDYDQDAARVAALEVPPDLVLPKTDDHYTIPQGGSTQPENYSDYSRNGTSCSCKETATAPVNASPPKKPQVAAAASAPPKLQVAPGGGKSILVSEPFDRCWLDVGQALDSAHIGVDDRDRSKGLLFLKGGHNQVTVRAVAAGCEVAVSDGSGAASDETNRITDALYKNLGK